MASWKDRTEYLGEEVNGVAGQVALGPASGQNVVCPNFSFPRDSGRRFLSHPSSQDLLGPSCLAANP
jgi:hypothetical protein